MGRRFLDPGDPLRRLALELLPGTAGLTAPMAEAVLDGMARDWTPDRLEALLQAELGTPEVLDGFRPGRAAGRVRAVGPGLGVHVGAGNVPGVMVTSMIRGLLVKSAVLAKPGRADVVLPVLFARAIAETAPELSGSVAVVYWPGGGGGPEDEALRAADLVVAYGGAEAVEGIACRLPSTTRLVAYNHRISFGVIGRESLGPHHLRHTTELAARAVALFDQRGCVSPHLYYVEEGGAITPEEWAGQLAEALAALEETLPAGPLSLEEASRIRQERGTAELRAADGSGVRVFHPGGPTWTVVYDPRPDFEASCLGRFVRVKPVDDLKSVAEWVRPFAPYLQTVGLTGGGGRVVAVAEALSDVGVSRVAPLGDLPFPPPWWHHDGTGPLEALIRWVDLEGESTSGPGG